MRNTTIVNLKSGDDLRKDIMGVEFNSMTLTESVDCAMDVIGGRGGGYVVTPNPEILWMCRTDEELKAALKNAEMVLPDGMGVLLSARILKKRLKEKVSGVDFGLNLARRLGEVGGSVYLLGAKPGVAEGAAIELRRRSPGIKIVGVHHGYFDDDSSIIDQINSVRPDFLIVCLGAPRQEKWMRKNRDKLDVGIMAGLGGVLDVLAGTVKRAPESWQKRNLEWLYRLINEPCRIRRQIKIPLFLCTVIGRRIRGVESDD